MRAKRQLHIAIAGLAVAMVFAVAAWITGDKLEHGTVTLGRNYGLANATSAPSDLDAELAAINADLRSRDWDAAAEITNARVDQLWLASDGQVMADFSVDGYTIRSFDMPTMTTRHESSGNAAALVNDEILVAVEEAILQSYQRRLAGD